ncbi:MAG: DUF58 domain-containing protein, partial [Sedimentisphaerales bacterium]|nr:DUF58 domain-containing protein [Sedimentisphaerales bacterium]
MKKLQQLRENLIRRLPAPIQRMLNAGERYRSLWAESVSNYPRLTSLSWVPSLFNPRFAFRFLWMGIVLVIVTCVLGIVAINTNAGLLYLLLGLMLGSWLVSGICSLINLSGISITRTVGNASQVGEKLIVTYTVTNHKHLFRSYALVIEEMGHLPMILPSGFVMSIGPRQTQTVTIITTCRRRGHLRLRRLRVSSRFPFGLVAKCFFIPEAADIVVHPPLGRIRYDLLSRQTGAATTGLGQYNQQTKGFEEFYGLREFQPYDNVHWIHWRSSAKFDHLLVREMAEYNTNQVTILLDTRVEDPLSVEQQEALEHAISFAATLIDRATERCLPVALVISGGEVKIVKHGRGLGHRWGLMTDLSGVRMGSWNTRLPSFGGFRPRSFVDAHCWIIGVGIRRHLPEEVSRTTRNVTIIDALNDDFFGLFT